MDVPVSMALDDEGFLRRECPNCNRQFKWHNGPANAEAESQPDSGTYYCPFCGEPAEAGRWWTQEQIEYGHGVALSQALPALADEFFDGLKNLNSKHFKVTRSGHDAPPDAPMPLVEPTDMTVVTSPCHPWQPVKIPDDAKSPLHCLVCGATYTL